MIPTPVPTALASSDTPRRDPTRRTVLGLGMAAAGLVGSGSAAAQTAILLPRMRSQYQRFAELPVVRPQHVPQDDGLLFYVQHSINANVIVYATHRGADGRIDPDRPIEVFWRRFQTAGHRRELSFFERMFAFGVSCTADGEGAWAVYLVSLPGREGRFDTGPDGKPRFVLEIDHRPMRPVYIYAEAIADGFIPTIRHVDVFAVADGEKGYTRERIIFG